MPMIAPLNFFTTTLRSPVGIGDTQLLLKAGSSTPLNALSAGDYVYVTVLDGMTTEIMKYISAGTVINDTITVVRAQDGTTVKAFPAGACVKVSWNVQQVVDLIGATVTGDIVFPRNTVEGTDDTGPVGIPAANVYYAINVDTGSLWYWKGPGAGDWVWVNSNSIQLLSTNPTDNPNDNILWTVNITTSQLFFWNGISWVAISANNYQEMRNRQYLSVTGTLFPNAGDYVFGDLVTANTIAVTNTATYQSNPVISPVVSLNANNAPVFNENCWVQFSAAIKGVIDSDVDDFKVRLVLFHAGNTAFYDNEVIHPANIGGTEVGVTVTTGPIRIGSGDVWDVNMSLVNPGNGFTLNQFEFNVAVVALA